MVLSFNEAFEVTWKDPADAEANWRMEKQHYPYPQSALGQDLFTAYVEDCYGGKVTYVNGYAFMKGTAPVPQTDEVRRRGAVEIWRDDYLPKIKQSVTNIRGRDYDALPAEEIALSLPGLFHEISLRMLDTLTVVQGFIQPAVRLTAFCEQEIGEGGATLAVSLLQGFSNETARSMSTLEGLAAYASTLPVVADAIREGRFDTIADQPGGGEFNARFEAFLDEFGWRAESWCLFHVPTWAEEPSTPLVLVRRYLSEPERTPSALAARAVSEREAAAREIESRLEQAKLDEFRGLRRAAERHVEISEERTLWQLLLVGSGRVPVLALGRKLVEVGVMGDPKDAAFLYVDELVELASNPEPRHGLIEQRKAELSRWEQLTPPDWLGARLAPAPMNQELADFFRYFVGAGQAGVEGQVIKGVGVSKGSVRGKARVILELQDSDKLQPGDILVCRTTSAPWSPLIAIAGGVVTDTGGLLSHSAIVAREYAIPCVTGTRSATDLIADGAMVTVDGEKGTVTLES